VLSASTFSNFFLGRDLVEMDGCNISAHFALRSADTDLLDEAVWMLGADGTIVNIVGEDDNENAEEYPKFMVWPGMERVFFQYHMVIKERVLIKIKMIQNSSNALKKCMFLKKDNGRRAMFGSILNDALLNILIHVADDPFDKETDVDYKNVVLCRIVELIFHMRLHILGVG
jgi:hypothetical protein